MVGLPGRYFSRKVPTRRVVPSVPPPGADPRMTSMVLPLKLTSASAFPAAISRDAPQKSASAARPNSFRSNDGITFPSLFRLFPSGIWRTDAPYFVETVYNRRATLARSSLRPYVQVCGDPMNPTANPNAPARRPRAKSPLVWLDMDQQELDDAYDQTVYAPNREEIRARRAANNAIAIGIIGTPERVAYGPTEIEKVDIYKTKAPNAPVMIYIHGGAWKGGSSSQVAYMAEVFLNAGAHFIAVDFNNVNEVGVSIFPMVDQVRRAAAWVYQNAKSFGGDPARIYVTGHSSGGHLASCV